MANITAAQVKELRDMTDSPMMECKKALVEAEGDMELAVDILRKNGLAAAAKKAGRATNEGAIGAYVSEDGTLGAHRRGRLRDRLRGLQPHVHRLRRQARRASSPTTEPACVEALLASEMDGETVEAALTELIHVIGENMKINALRRSARPSTAACSSYVHMGGKIGVLVEFSFEKPETAHGRGLQGLRARRGDAGRGNAAPICARPRGRARRDRRARDESIYMAQAAESGKPEAIQEKMAVGRLEKFYKGVVLNEQEFIKDSSLTIAKYAEQVSKEAGDTIAVRGFDRLARGEA